MQVENFSLVEQFIAIIVLLTIVASVLIWQFRRCRHVFDVDVERLKVTTTIGSQEFVKKIIYIRKCSKCGKLHKFVVNREGEE